MDNSCDRAPLPLEGLRVLDATHIVAGPFCSLILADMGLLDMLLKVTSNGG